MKNIPTISRVALGALIASVGVIALSRFMPASATSCFIFFSDSCMVFRTDALLYASIFLFFVAIGLLLRTMEVPHPLFIGIFGGLLGYSIYWIAALVEPTWLYWIVKIAAFLVGFYLISRLASTKLNIKAKVAIASALFVATWLAVRYIVWTVQF